MNSWRDTRERDQTPTQFDVIVAFATDLRFVGLGLLGAATGVAAGWVILCIFASGTIPANVSSRSLPAWVYFELFVFASYLVAGLAIGLAAAARPGKPKWWLLLGLVAGFAAAVVVAFLGIRIEEAIARYAQYDHMYLYAAIGVACVLTGAVAGLPLGPGETQTYIQAPATPAEEPAACSQSAQSAPGP